MLLWRVPFGVSAGLILLFNGLLVALVLLEPIDDATLALVVNTAQFVGPLLAVPLCFGGLLRRMWGRGDYSRTGVDERAALGPCLAGPGYSLLGFGTVDLHLL